MPALLDPRLRAVLQNLAEAIVPLSEWLAKPDKFVPPEPNLPWRAPGATLTTQDLKVIPFFENLLAQDVDDEKIEARWRQLESDALKFNPLPDTAQWRADRKLEPTPAFGAAASDNVVIGLDDPQKGRQTRSRASFYDACWPLLKNAAQAAKPATPDAWKVFSQNLFADKVTDWPPKQSPKSSEFIKQFAKDILYALLGMKGDVPEPLKFGVLIELGEHRRVGNAYEVGDAQTAVNTFKAKIKEVAGKPKPSP
jgi:hypothetical protein